MDPLTDAPAPITAEQRRESGIDAKPKKKGGQDDKAAAAEKKAQPEK